MNRFYLLCIALCGGLVAFAQTPFKDIPHAANAPSSIDVEALNFRLPAGSSLLQRAATNPRPRPFDPARIAKGLALPQQVGLKIGVDPESGQIIRIAGRAENLVDGTANKKNAIIYLRSIARELGLDGPNDVLRLGSITTDALGHQHARISQFYRGLRVEPADAKIHATSESGFDLYLGRLQPTPGELEVVPSLTSVQAENRVKNAYDKWVELSAENRQFLEGPQLSSELIVYFTREQEAKLAYRVEAHPHLAKHETHYIDAHTGGELWRISNYCGITHDLHEPSDLPPTTASGRDLNGIDVNINTFEENGTYFLFDVTREMFRTEDGDALGTIKTFDAMGTTPLNDDFSASLATSDNNSDWSPTAISVHANAGIAYEYYRTRHTRNAIDGIGGDIQSVLNVSDEDGTELDNAFWGANTMFYGNGNQAFINLPRALDIAGHEMTHGVIDATADLVYEFQPGAINESMADVFGYLIEGETGDFRLAEDVTNRQFFSSGSLRNMQDPNNGGNSLNDRGWQPAHMDEFQELTADQDNGGVHVNSGIPNRAFYLFTTAPAVGDTRAERVYYRALTEYLTRSSQFGDLRIAVEQAASDLYGADVVAAASAAFEAVGIGGGQAGDYEDDLEVNDGDRFLLLTDVNQDDLFLATEDGAIIEAPLARVSILSRPSIADDGSSAFFVDDQNRIRFYDFVQRQLAFVEDEPSNLWRNIAVSKDGRRIAITTTLENNRIFVGDLVSGDIFEFELTNPTTAEGGLSTNNVQYPDIIEWSADGEFLLYDALNEEPDGTTYWDIGFLRAWDIQRNTFGDGQIFKLYTRLDPGVSIGNPTFSKNSPYIIAFERAAFNDFTGAVETSEIITANIEQGETGSIFSNLRLSYPSFGVADDRIVFDGELEDQTRVLGVIPLSDDKLSTTGGAVSLVENGHWGDFFATGERDLSTSIEGPVVEDDRVRVYPTVVDKQVTIERPEATVGTLRVLDVMGKSLGSYPLAGNRITIELNDLPTGNYLLAIPVAGGTVIKKIVH